MVTASPRVLIVEDQRHVARALELVLEVEGATTRWAATPDEALVLAQQEEFDLVIQDMNFTPGETSGDAGVELFRSLRTARAELPVLLMTAWGSLETAVQLMKEGAADYIEKPWSDDRLLASVRTHLRLARLESATREQDRERASAREDLAARHDLCELVYADPAMHEVLSLAVRVAKADVPILITGANGSGKEKLADIVHANSLRRDRPFIKINAGALPDTLVEAELFGAEAGAYTGADKRRIGRFEAADGGTLLLDEIGNLPAAGQAKLLRVLQTGEFERLGSSHTQRVDVRVIAATNADLEAEMKSGSFREDLYFRLNVIELEVPGLAQRREDIIPLARHLLNLHGREASRPDLAFGELAIDALLAFSWPGNVRELENRVRRACLVATSAVIAPSDLGLQGAAAVDAPRTAARPIDSDDPEAVERAKIESVLRDNAGVVSRAAEHLGLSRQALYRRMRRLGLVVERRARSTAPGDS
ncbi:MAG: sigma-54-dependent Fis family transcriptional regulator [bacterium]|nr:sigma-54-dependent Fis family transcriptional regulator [bacterium]